MLRFTAVALAFATNVVLARLLGAAGYGAYTYTLSWVMLFSMFVVSGLERLLVRDVSIYAAQSSWGLLAGLLRWVSGMALLLCLALLGLLSGVYLGLIGRFDTSLLVALPVAAILLPLLALMRLLQSALRGFRRVISSQLPEMMIQPALMIALVAAVSWVGSGTMDASQAMAIYAVTSGIACACGLWLLGRVVPPAVKTSAPVYRHHVWMMSAVNLIVLSGLDVINNRVDLLLLGAFKGAEAVGIYSAASRSVQLVPFTLLAANLAMAPIYASLYAAGRRADLQRLVTHSSRLILLGGAPAALGLILFGRWFLLLFGADFVHGQTALTILCVGQLVNVAAGPVAVLLTMTGHERDTVIGVGIGTLVNVVLNLLLIPPWGIEGAAVAVAASLIAWNLVLTWFVWQRLAISSTALGDFWASKAG